MTFSTGLKSGVPLGVAMGIKGIYNSIWKLRIGSGPRYRRSPHVVIFGTKRVSRNSGITNFETLLSTKSQIGPNNFLKSTFLANFLVDYLVFFEIFMSSWKKSWKKGVKKVNPAKGLDNIAKKTILIKKVVRFLV